MTKTLIIALKNAPRLYESTDIAFHLWQNISSELHISTCSYDKQETGLGGHIADSLLAAANSPKKIVVTIAHKAFLEPKEIINKVTQYIQGQEGWEIQVLREED
jgi:hypothetical protein